MNSSIIEVSRGERVRRILIWDWVVRLGHWSFAVGVVAAYVTSQYALSDWHSRIGATLLWFLTFRVVWGFVGSTHARFAHFFPTPGRIGAFFRGKWRGYGHSPLGALSVFALLLMLAVQIATGLFANDDVAFQGPLAVYVTKPTSDTVTAWHARAFYALLTLVVLHVAAIVFYAVVKKKNLVTPMLTGTKTFAVGEQSGDARVRRSAFVLAALIACGVVWFAFGASHVTSPPPPSPAAAPDW